MSLSGPGARTTPEMFEEFLRRITDGESLKAICRTDGLPSKWTILQKLSKDEEFSKAYSEAMRLRTEVLAHEILDIADATTAETWQQDRLRIDTRKFILVHLLPEKYGDKVELKHSGGVTVNATPVDQAL